MSKIKVKRKIPIVMPSSLIQQNFGETVSKHGFLFWDVKKMTYVEYDVPSNYSHFLFTINSIDDLENGEEKHINP